MSIILSFLINLLSALFGFIIGKIWRLVHIRIEQRSLRQFWTFTNSSVAIVFPMYGDPRDPGAPKTMAHVEDVLAIAKISRLLDGFKQKYTLDDDNTVLRTNEDLILICSPKGNKQSAKFVKDIQLPFNYVENGPYFKDSMTGTEYAAVMDKKEGDADLGLIAKLKLTNPCRTVFLIWGLHGPGTFGAAEFSVNTKNMLSIDSKIRKNGGAFLLHVPFHRKGGDDKNGVREPGVSSITSPVRNYLATENI